MKKILITGAAGFIGFHLIKKLCSTFAEDVSVVGIDNLNDYYDVNLKHERLVILNNFKNFEFIKGDIASREFLQDVFNKHQFNYVVNLAAQAGVRYSLENPDAYLKSNVDGFFNLLSILSTYSKNDFFEHFVYASSSSVYALSEEKSFSEEHSTDKPVSLYAATKKTNEILAFTYSKLFNIKMTGLRFFTVYGPFGRPDMAYFSFTEKAVKGEKIQLFNFGELYRDFTYIDDIVLGIENVMFGEVDYGIVPHRIYNIGNNTPVALKDFVQTLESLLLKHNVISAPFNIEYVEMQKGDVYRTCANIDSIKRDFDFNIYTSIYDGLEQFVLWYRSFYK